MRGRSVKLIRKIWGGTTINFKQGKRIWMNSSHKIKGMYRKTLNKNLVKDN
jgi:hypothetical protein